ncbi:zinc metallopeptidase [Verrucomicrobiaceae bacterium 227]
MKFILLAGLIPVILSFLARKFFFERIVKREGGAEVSLNGLELAEKVLKKGKAGEVEVTVKKRSFVKLDPTHLVLSPEQATSRRADHVAEAGLLAGMVLMARQQEKVVGWRTWALKFSWAMPSFTTVVMAFALVTRGLSASWCLGILAGVLGLSTVLLWLTLPVEKAAATTVAEMLEETALIPRRNEAERLVLLVKAMPWRRIIPGAIAWIGRK